MKNTLILIWFLLLTIGIHATPLDDKIKDLADAIREADAAKAIGDPGLGGHMLSFAGALDSADRSPEGMASLEQSVRQILQIYPAAKVQAAAQALLTQIGLDKQAYRDEMAKSLDDLLARAKDTLLKATEAKELDPLLEELQKKQAAPSNFYNDPQLQQLSTRVNAAYTFVSQWQDFLFYRASGSNQEAQNALRNLSSAQLILVPRSEILARMAALPGPKPGQPQYPDPPLDITPYIDKIKTLDDIQSQLGAFTSERGNGNGGFNNYDVASLNRLAVLYSRVQNGLPVNLDLAPLETYGGTEKAQLNRVKAMLLLYLLPRYLGAGALPPAANESVADYLKRSLEDAKTRKDSLLLSKVIQAQLHVAGTPAPPGTHSFLAGINQEVADQLTLAVTSYETALKDPDEFLLPEVVGFHLDSIKQDHPTEFADGMKNFLSPPQPQPMYFNQFGMRQFPMFGNPTTPPVPPSPVPATQPGAVPAISPKATSPVPAVVPKTTTLPPSK